VTGNTQPPDPFGGPGSLTEAAAEIAEKFNALCAAGIPARHVAVIVGTWLGVMGNDGQEGGDGT